jgi:hypothetical protein
MAFRGVGDVETSIYFNRRDDRLSPVRANFFDHWRPLKLKIFITPTVARVGSMLNSNDPQISIQSDRTNSYPHQDPRVIPPGKMYTHVFGGHVGLSGNAQITFARPLLLISHYCVFAPVVVLIDSKQSTNEFVSGWRRVWISVVVAAHVSPQNLASLILYGKCIPVVSNTNTTSVCDRLSSTHF